MGNTLQVYLIWLAAVSGAASQAGIFPATGFQALSLPGEGYASPIPVALHHRYRYDQRLAEFNAFARQLNADFERAFQATEPLLPPLGLGVAAAAEARLDAPPPAPEESHSISIGLPAPFVPRLELPRADEVYQAKRERAIADLWRRAQQLQFV